MDYCRNLCMPHEDKDHPSQHDFYDHLVRTRRATRAFSCGFRERFDPFLLDRKPFLADVYETVFRSLFDGVAERPPRALDVGCGTGLYWPVLIHYVDDLVGIDASAAMIEEAERLVGEKKLARIETGVQNTSRIGFPDAHFDAVISIDALHHMPDLKSAIKEFHRVLKPGGRFLAVEPNMLNPLMFLAHLIPPEERYGVTRSYAPVLRRLFRPYFVDIEIDYVNYVASAETARQLRRVKSIGAMLEALPLLRALSLRQTLSMKKPG